MICYNFKKKWKRISILLAGLTAAVNLVIGHEVEWRETDRFGEEKLKWEDKDGNHEMGLHVFFYNYANLF